MNDVSLYGNLLSEIKSRLRTAQTKAVFSINAEMIRMYYEIGKLIHEKQKREGWGSSFILRLSKDIRNELPEIKGFSERNIGYMIRFAREYESAILQQAVAKLTEQPFFIGIPWGHHIIMIGGLIECCFATSTFTVYLYKIHSCILESKNNLFNWRFSKTQ